MELYFMKYNNTISFYFFIVLYMSTLYFSPELTAWSIFYEAWVVVFLICITLYWIKRYRFFLWRFLILAFWVLCFEILTSSLWLVEHLWSWSYINGDISIIMTFAWTSIIMWSKFVYDNLFSQKTLFKEFSFVILISSFLWLGNLLILKYIWVFSYSIDMSNLIQNGILIFWRPLEALLYFPTFILCSYSFYKYWELAMYNKHIFKSYKINFLKDFGISIITLILIWYVLHPMIYTEASVNYVYITWALLFVLFITNISIEYINQMPQFIKFLWATSIFSSFWILILSYFVGNGWIVLSESTRNVYSDITFTIPWLSITDVEVVWVIILSYFLISIIRYFKVVTDNKKIVLDEKDMTFQWWKSLIENK